MKVVAVTSCATGIAHTYMAAEAIMKVCKREVTSVRSRSRGSRTGRQVKRS
ncbi:MAG: hypothetical protein ACLVI9_04835 [Anaerostipes hadrus]